MSEQQPPADEIPPAETSGEDGNVDQADEDQANAKPLDEIDAADLIGNLSDDERAQLRAALDKADADAAANRPPDAAEQAEAERVEQANAATVTALDDSPPPHDPSAPQPAPHVDADGNEIDPAQAAADAERATQTAL